MNALTTIAPLCVSLPDCTYVKIDRSNEVDHLFAGLDQISWAKNPRTARLMRSSLRRLSQKVVEEAAEVALEGVRKRNGAVVLESADLIYHLVVLWHALGIQPDLIWTEMRHRADTIGIAEKLPKSKPRASAQR